jgi:hypothetical protein
MAPGGAARPRVTVRIPGGAASAETCDKEGVVRRRSSVFVFTLLALLVGAGAAQADLGLKALEARLGFVDPEKPIDNTFIVSAAMDLGRVTPDLGLEINIDFWSKSQDVLGEDWTATSLGFLANLGYMFKTDSSFHPFLFGGMGLHYWDADDAAIELGFDAGAGAEFGKGNMIPVARVGFNLNGGADYMFIQGGLKFPMD